jgi:transcriptional regulator with XRE-family HTH domain
MSQKLTFPQLREQAIALRLAGKSRREIMDLTGVRGNRTLDDMLRGVPPPPWTRRPRAKDDLHEKARDLRARGFTYNEIAAELGVSKGSISLWVRDMPRPGRLSYEEYRSRNAEGLSAYWQAEQLRREARRQAVRDSAAAEISDLSEREILIAGAIAYWCEGAKSKPHRRSEQISFINSDPQLISFFLRFLATAGVTHDRLICRLYIHQSADVAAAQQYWLDQTGLPAEQFRRPTLKRHNPKTTRKNTGQDYHGCLVINVRRSAELYRQVEGWASAAMAAAGAGTP